MILNIQRFVRAELLVCRRDHCLDGRSKTLGQVCAGPQMSLSLCGLQTEFMAVMGMVDFDKTALGERESLGRSSM